MTLKFKTELRSPNISLYNDDILGVNIDIEKAIVDWEVQILQREYGYERQFTVNEVELIGTQDNKKGDVVGFEGTIKVKRTKCFNYGNGADVKVVIREMELDIKDLIIEIEV